MGGYYVYQTIYQDTELYYFDYNTYDEDYDFTINHCVDHESTLQDHEHVIITP